MPSKKSRHITSLLVVLAVIAVGIFLQSSPASQKEQEPAQALSPVSTPSPDASPSRSVWGWARKKMTRPEATGTPDAPSTPMAVASPPIKFTERPIPGSLPYETGSFKVKGAPHTIDDKRAPLWWIRRSQHYPHDSEEGWIFQHNHRRFVPDFMEPLGNCTETSLHVEIENASSAVLSERFEDWYRYKCWVEADSMETDKSEFRIHVATTEYYPPEWRSDLIRELAAKTGVKPEQIKLTVPPAEKTGSDEWVEGKTHQS